MKRLTIVYAGVELFDGDVAELTWTDTAGGVRVEGKTRAAGGSGLLDLIAGASKASTEQRRQELIAQRDTDTAR